MKFTTAISIMLALDNMSGVAESKAPKRVRQRTVKREQRHRRTKGRSGKGKGGSIDVETEPPQTSIAPTDIGNSISNDGSHLDLICGIFQSYHDLVAADRNDADFCSAFDLDKALLCPNSYEMGIVCSGVQSGLSLNESLEANYCGALFDEMYNDQRMMFSCVEYCSNFVNDGDCCDVACN